MSAQEPPAGGTTGLIPVSTSRTSNSDNERLTTIYLRLMMLAMPALLLLTSVWAALRSGTIEHSISAYHGGLYGDYFVGMLFALAACMIAYKGSDLEDFALNVSGFCALFVAIVPENLADIMRKEQQSGVPGSQVGARQVGIWSILIVAGLFVLIDLRSGLWAPVTLVKRRFTFVLTILAGVAVAAFVALVVIQTLRATDFGGVHLFAAVLLIAGLAVAVASHGWPEQTLGITQGPSITTVQRNSYRTIFWLMAVGIPALILLKLLQWPYAVITVEWYEIILFGWFWTIEIKRTINVPALLKAT